MNNFDMLKDHLKGLESGKCLFHMHIPKVAGTSINRCLEGNSNYVNGEHGFCQKKVRLRGSVRLSRYWPDYREHPYYNNAIRFAVIRNPFDWLASYYFHKGRSLHGLISHSGWGGCNDIHKFKTFEGFVKAYCDDTYRWHCEPLHRSILAPIYDSRGSLCADFVLPFENVAKFVNFIDTYTDMNVDIRHLKSNINITKPSYKKIYSDALIDLVTKKFCNLMHLYGYSYTGFDADNVALEYDGCIVKPTQEIV